MKASPRWSWLILNTAIAGCGSQPSAAILDGAADGNGGTDGNRLGQSSDASSPGTDSGSDGMSASDQSTGDSAIVDSSQGQSQIDVSKIASSFLINPAHTNAVKDPTIVPPLFLAWTQTFGTASYPLIAGGLVYLVVKSGPAGNAQGNPKLVALDEMTGAVRWGPIDLGLSAIAGHAYDSGVVLVLDQSDAVVRGFDGPTGRLLWSTNLTPDGSGSPNFSEPPTAYRGILYFASDGVVYAVSVSTGSILWKATVPYGWTCAPAVDDHAVFIEYACNQAFALDPGTGRPLWASTAACTGQTGSAPAVFAGKVFVPNSMGGESVFDEMTGSLIASYPAYIYPAFDGTVAFLNDAAATIDAVDLSSGKNAWTYGRDSSTIFTPVVAGGTVYVPWAAGMLFGLDESTGEQAWDEAVAAFDTNEPIVAGEGVLIARSYGQIFAYRHRDVPDASVLDRAPDGGCPSWGCFQQPIILAVDNPYRIALGPTNVYWVNGDVRTMPKAGGKPSTLYSNMNLPATAVATDSSNVYWAASNYIAGSPTNATITEMPLDGGTAVTLVSNSDAPSSYMVVGPNNVYWSILNGPDAVLSAPISSGPTQVVASNTRGGGPLAIDANNIYWSTDAVYMMPLAGGPSRMIAPAVVAMASDDTDLYFFQNQTVARVPLNGGTPTVLIDGRSGSSGIAVDSANVYWIDGAGIAALPKSGGRVAILASGLGSLWDLAVDQSGVYFASQDGVGKIAR